MSWFNFYNRKIPIIDEDGNILGIKIKTDNDKIKEDTEFYNYLEENKGKFVRVYDDNTFEELSQSEINLIEEESKLALPYIVIEGDKSIIDKQEIIKANRAKRRYKPKRIIISPELRIKVYEKYNGRCRRCEDYNANQIHHIDKNPSHTWLSNLELLCYDCHLEADGKKMYKYEKEG